MVERVMQAGRAAGSGSGEWMRGLIRVSSNSSAHRARQCGRQPRSAGCETLCLKRYVIERRREIGVMRAVGASSGDVAFIFAGEGLLLGLLSWIVAVPLGLFGAQFFVEALGRAIAFPFFYRLSFSGAVTWVVIIVALSLLASWLPARRATQISVRESLAYE
jgi:ABC-type lipoprotein release transport system permease subunit